MKLSIIVPIYNISLYLKKCLDSIIKENADDIEIILIDDGSTDGSGIICDDYQKKINALKLCIQKIRVLV